MPTSAFHEFMSRITLTSDGRFNRFGRIYWPLRDLVVTWTHRVIR